MSKITDKRRASLPVEATYAKREDGAPSDRRIKFLASSNAVARDGGIMEAWDVQDFLSNPVFLWSHNPDTPPIGRAVSVTHGGGGLEIEVEFAGPEQGHAFADLIWKLYRSGFMNAVSVGFRVTAEREPTEEERKAGARWVGTGLLLELSAVAVPADPLATVLGPRELSGMFTRADVSAAKAQFGAIEPWQPILRSLETALDEKPIVVGRRTDAPNTATYSEVCAVMLRCEDLLQECAGLIAEMHAHEEAPRSESSSEERTAPQEASAPPAVEGVSAKVLDAPSEGRDARILDVIERHFPCPKPTTQ